MSQVWQKVRAILVHGAPSTTHLRQSQVVLVHVRVLPVQKQQEGKHQKTYGGHTRGDQCRHRVTLNRSGVVFAVFFFCSPKNPYNSVSFANTPNPTAPMSSLEKTTPK